MRQNDKRHLIMQAAETLFTSRRFHELTLDDVARAAQVGKGTIYRYFADKDDLFFQLATSGFDDLCELLRQDVPSDGPFEDQLLHACERISRFFEDRRQLFRLMQQEDARMAWCKPSLRQRWAQKRMSLVEAVMAVLARGVDEGKLRADLPAEVLAHFLLGILRTQAREMRNAGIHLDLPTALQMFRFGAATPPPATATGTAAAPTDTPRPQRSSSR